MDPSIQRVIDQLNRPSTRKVIRQAEQLHAQHNRVLLNNSSAIRAAREAQRIQAQHARVISDASLFSVQNLLNSTQVQRTVANALNIQEQVLRGLNSDVIRAARQVAQQVAQTRQDHLDRAISQIQTAGAASVLNQAIEFLSSPQTKALIEQANANALRAYARGLAEATTDELAYEPTIEEAELDWIFELDKESLRALCRVLIPILDALQVVAGFYAVAQHGLDTETALLLANSVRILLTYALAALAEKDE